MIVSGTELADTGLTEVEAARRLEARGGFVRRRSSRSYDSIVRANTVTIPNGILLLFGVLTITFGSWRDALFLGILVSNIAIGSFQLVLVRDDFRVVPGMVAEGRQILRNIQRVARLFTTKSVFTAAVGLALAIPTGTFPLLPRQFTIASTVTIGVPAFLLALAPSSGPWRPERFLQSVARFAIPAGVAIGIGIIAGYLLARYGFDLSLTRSRTVATGIVVVCGLAVVIRLETEPGRRLAVADLCALMALVFALALIVPFLRNFYELATPTGEAVAAWALGTALGIGTMIAALRLLRV